MPEIDVVIATRNRERKLIDCLEGLTRQTFRDFVVVVVDDASDRPVRDAIPDSLAAQLALRVIRCDSNVGPGRARNCGVAEGSAEYIVFIDDDIVPDAGLLLRHRERMAACERPSVLFGPLAEPADWKPSPWTLWESRKLAREYARMSQGNYAPTWRQLFTGNAFLRRDAFMRVGGFDERFTRAEDIELGLRLAKAGHEFVFVSDAIGWHYAERSLDTWLEIPRRYARADAAIDRLHPSLGWLALVRRDQRRRSISLRAARAAARPALVRRAVTYCAARGAGMLFRCKMQRASLALLSLAYDVEYSASLSQVLRQPADDPQAARYRLPSEGS